MALLQLFYWASWHTEKVKTACSYGNTSNIHTRTLQQSERHDTDFDHINVLAQTYTVNVFESLHDEVNRRPKNAAHENQERIITRFLRRPKRYMQYA